MLYLDNNDVDALLPMQECVQVMEDLFTQEGQGLVENRARQTVQLEAGGGIGGFHRLMMGAAMGFGAFGFKSYTPSRPGGMRYYVMLHDLKTGALTAFVEARRLGELRTGAVAALATKYMAKAEAARKLIYLALVNAVPAWTRTRNWTTALLAFKIHFGDRLPD